MMPGRLLSILACFILCVSAALAQQSNNQASVAESTNLQTLLDKFKSDDDIVRYEALKSIAKVGRNALPSLINSLKKEHGYSRVYAVRAINEIDPGNELIQRTLITISKDAYEKRDVRRYSSYVLGLSSAGIPELAKMLEDKDIFVRRSAAFALRELYAISASLDSSYRQPLTNALAPIIASMGDEDSLVQGLAIETIEEVRGDIDFALDYCIDNSPNRLLRENAKAVKEKRRQGIKETAQEMTMDMKPGAEEQIKKDSRFRHGNLGVIYALRIGGEPVLDFRSIPGVVGAESLRMTINPLTRRASTGLSKFNPYLDLD